MSNKPEWKARSTPEAADIMKSSRSGLSRLLAMATRLDHLEKHIKELLDPGLADHVRLANIREHTIILVTPVAAIGTRIKMEAPALLRALQEKGVQGINEIKVIIAPIPSE